jgi:monoamine oxidase
MAIKHHSLASTNDRRAFMKSLAAGAAVGVLPGAAQTQPSNEKSTYDVLILGGGFAGVSAARELGQAGLRCLLLEARPRLGGRTFSTEVFGKRSEVGGQWIHWLQPHVWSEVARYGLELYETPGAASPKTVGVLGARGLDRQDPAANFAMLQAAMQKVCAESRELFPRPYDPFYRSNVAELDRLSVQDRLDSLQLDPLSRDAVTAYLTTNINALPRDAGLLDQIHWFARAGHDMERLLQACAQFKIKSGTSDLINKMLADARVQVELNTPIATVEQSASGVRMVAADGRAFAGRTAVVALPMNCWADIDWQPAISPEKIAASKQRHAGRGYELHIQIAGEPNSYLAMAPAPHPISLLYTDTVDADGTVMVALGPDSKDFDINDDTAIVRELQRLMPEAKFLRSFAYDWNADPYAKGTWCNYRPNMWSRYGRAMRQIEGRIAFAGSDVADGWRGFIDGAIETGLRASREIKALLAGA